MTKASRSRQPDHGPARSVAATSGDAFLRLRLLGQKSRAGPARRCTTNSSHLATHKDWEGRHGYDTANDRHHHRQLIGRALTSRRPRSITSAAPAALFCCSCRKFPRHDLDHIARRFAPRVRAAGDGRRRGRVDRPRPGQGGAGRPRGRGRRAQGRRHEPSADARRQSSRSSPTRMPTAWRSSATRRRTCWPTR